MTVKGEEEIGDSEEQEDPSCSHGRIHSESMGTEVEEPKHWRREDHWDSPGE